jgi:DNA-binding NtrC family response regulator
MTSCFVSSPLSIFVYQKLAILKHNRICFLIDDDIEDQEIFQIALHRVDGGFDFVTANNGAEGLRILKEDDTFVPEFIFLDLNMPKMNGMQCLPEIRRLGHLKDVKIIIYSTSSDPAIIDASKSLGAYDFLVKPHKMDVLVNKLSELLEN